MSYSWQVRCDSSPHGTSWPHGERSICLENDFKIARSHTLFELCGSEKCMKKGETPPKVHLLCRQLLRK